MHRLQCHFVVKGSSTKIYHKRSNVNTSEHKRSRCRLFNTPSLQMKRSNIINRHSCVNRLFCCNIWFNWFNTIWVSYCEVYQISGGNIFFFFFYFLRCYALFYRTVENVSKGRWRERGRHAAKLAKFNRCATGEALYLEF